MRLLPIALGLPGTIGFPTAIAHHRSPHGQVTEVSYAGKNIIVYHPSHGNSAPTSRMDCFVDSLLAARSTMGQLRQGTLAQHKTVTDKDSAGSSTIEQSIDVHVRVHV